MNKRLLFLSQGILVVFSAGLIVCSLSCDLKKMSQKVMYNRARNLHDHGKIAEAIVVYQRVLESEGNNTAVYYDLGVAYADINDIENATKQVILLRKLDRADLAEVLAEVIRDSGSNQARKKLRTDKK